jgi:hypothetical protein
MSGQRKIQLFAEVGGKSEEEGDEKEGFNNLFHLVCNKTSPSPEPSPAGGEGFPDGR